MTPTVTSIGNIIYTTFSATSSKSVINCIMIYRMSGDKISKLLYAIAPTPVDDGGGGNDDDDDDNGQYS